MKLVNYHFKINNYELTNNKVNSKIVLISDIHYSHTFKKDKINLIINKIKELKPDYICITGDIIDNVKIIKEEVLKNEILSFLNELAKINKVIICKGNHDQFELIKPGFRCQYIFNENKEWFDTIKKQKNIYLLDNEVFEDKNIRFIGFTPSFTYYKEENKEENSLLDEIKQKMPFIDNKKYNVLLIHSPIHILNKKTYDETEIKNMNLILSGHTHNGMVPPILDSIFKNNYGLYSPNGLWLYKAKNTRGKYSYNNITLIINGGITKIHECSPKLMVPLNELFPMSIDYINITKK